MSEIASCHKVVGIKQSGRALRAGRVRKVFLACDADPMVLTNIEALCAEGNVPVEKDATMRELGLSAGIAVGASVIALLHD